MSEDDPEAVEHERRTARRRTRSGPAWTRWRGSPAGASPSRSLLIGVATQAVRAIPGADGAGLTLLEQSRSSTIVATADFVSAVEDIQYGIGEGPCISAAREGRTVVSGPLGADRHWQLFGSRVARLGVHSVLPLPLPLPTSDGVVGAMNVCAHAKHTFDDRAIELGELFAAPAAIAVQNAQVLAQAQRLTLQLQTALEEQQVVERAVGIMLSRSGGTAEEALDRSRRLSQSEHRKLVVVAQALVDEAVRRAARRHPEQPQHRGADQPADSTWGSTE